MKKMTRNDVYALANGRAIIKVPHCRLQNLLKHYEIVGYNSGVYGWNYDVYDCKFCLVVTGYRMAIAGYDVDDEYAKYADNGARHKNITDSWRDEWTPQDYMWGVYNTTAVFGK